MMMRKFLLPIVLIGSLMAQAGSFTLHVKTGGLGEDVASLYRYADLFTMRTVLVTRGLFDATGNTTLTGEVEGTMRVQLRIGERVCDLYVRPGSEYSIEAFDLGKAQSLSGTTPLGITFKDLDPLDINALVSDVNERIDAFIAEDLATDEAAGMQVVDIQRKEGTHRPDSAQRPPTLFVTPVLSKVKVDTFAFKLERFYADVKDPWFAHYLEYSIAGMELGPRVNERELFDAHVKGKPVLYDDPEYVRFIRNLFTDGLEQIDRFRGDSLALLSREGKKNALRGLFQRNDFLRNDDRLAELVMMDQLYLNHARRIVPQKDAETILMDVMANSTFTEHRRIADDMLWDLTTMRVGTMLPVIRLEDERGSTVQLDGRMQGPTCIAFTAGWCSYCATEMAGLINLGEEYPGAVNVIVIGLDKSLDAFNALKKAMAKNEFTWLHAVAEQELREELRLRSLPAFYLLNDGVLARSPAPLPSQGLGQLFLKAQVKEDRDKRIKVWDD